MQNYIDLSQLEKPEIIETLDVETIFQEVVDGFREHLNNQGEEQRIFNALLASDPAIKLMEYWSWREFLLRARINDAFAQTLLAYARGEALDHMAAAWNIARGAVEYDKEGKVVKWQTDDDLRKIVQMAPEGISTAGSRMSYIFHGLNLGRATKKVEVHKEDKNKIITTAYLNDADDNNLQAIRDVNAVCPKIEEVEGAERLTDCGCGAYINSNYAAGHVHVAALSYKGYDKIIADNLAPNTSEDSTEKNAIFAEAGKLTDESLEALKHHLSQDFIRPLTDCVTVMQGKNKEYQIKATVELMAGVDPQMVKAEAEKNLVSFVIERYKLGEVASIAGIYDAIHTKNVRSVKLIEPTQDVTCAWNEAPLCTLVELTEIGNG